MSKKRLEISFESREQWRIFSPDSAENVQCPFCEEDSPMLSVENLAVLTETSQLEIYREIERGSLHFVETKKSQLFVCLRSFLKRSLRSNEQEILVGS
jgi:hypothetical protein